MLQNIGVAAAFLTMFSFLPQIVKVAKTKSAKDVSLATLVQLSCGVSLWIIYGIYRKDAIIILANTVTLCTMLILLYQYFTLRKERK